MSFLRSERNAAAILLVAAALGLILANTGAGAELLSINAAHIGFPAINLDLSVEHWTSDGLLAVFFFIVAVELKHELVAGSLNSPAKALLPAIAALGGVIVPAGVYLLFNLGSPYGDGWPIPTATDIAFALGVLAIFGRALPGKVRVFLLALAVLDDLVAILIIAVFFTTSLNLPALAGAVACVAVFAGLSWMLARGGREGASGALTNRGLRVAIGVLMVLIALLTWDLVYQSGIHATIAGVALGLVMAAKPAARTAHTLQPWSNAIVLPLFAFSAALVMIPSVGITELSPAFWGILVALPVGKLLGITVAGWLGNRLVGRNAPRSSVLTLPDLVMIGGLGGIGFTVSLLMNELAFKGVDLVIDEGTLAVLLGSAVSIVAASLLVAARSRAYQRTAVGVDDEALDSAPADSPFVE
ncbi:Na+/H+ antiporter NhaA [Subtercola sp. YIM 133946]|uniref:Na+/H+ antiporter NhaA n=1 Tax=Subtercola sp. YIM 133946 TaxID=3118909 RepID=UPI002F934472